ncbi:hypothetical protein DSO57_1005270 [Entomophthora muscae]|uniref:Uncharacterized protein n=1 Tax=Entomophthora muscae TaxID=34485 RepID=A0ACC2SX58_9FUNG|nr:hypothetical protein DSO57_1005270 [Entomophthora muscae]
MQINQTSNNNKEINVKILTIQNFLINELQSIVFAIFGANALVNYGKRTASNRPFRKFVFRNDVPV